MQGFGFRDTAGSVSPNYIQRVVFLLAQIACDVAGFRMERSPIYVPQTLKKSH